LENKNVSQKQVLILCTGNSCRSQLAEAIINHDLAGQWKAYSAGMQPAGYVHPLALQALEEIGIHHDAAENCPVWLGKGKHAHIGFPDPAKAEGNDEERMGVFRQVRDDIRSRILAFLQAFPTNEKVTE
jgi:arsenate reductase